MNLGLKDKIVLITGASGGIGQATSKLFSNEGAKIAIHYAHDRAQTEELQKKLKTESFLVQGDVSDEKQIEQIFKSTIDHFGGLDIVVANAGIAPPEYTPIDQMDSARFKKVTNVNQFGVWLTSREYFRYLRRKKPKSASLIVISSTSGIFGEEGYSEYSMSKSAMRGLTLTLKNEIVKIVPNGRVNCVAPGWTWTPMTEQFRSDKEGIIDTLQTRALRRIARPEDIAHAIVLLASEEVSGYITGQTLRVDGGLEGRKIWNREDIDLTQA